MELHDHRLTQWTNWRNCILNFRTLPYRPTCKKILQVFIWSFDDNFLPDLWISSLVIFYIQWMWLLRWEALLNVWTGSSPLSLRIIRKKDAHIFSLCSLCRLLYVPLDLRVNELFRSTFLKNVYSAIVNGRQYGVIRGRAGARRWSSSLLWVAEDN